MKMTYPDYRYEFECLICESEFLVMKIELNEHRPLILCANCRKKLKELLESEDM